MRSQHLNIQAINKRGATLSYDIPRRRNLQDDINLAELAIKMKLSMSTTSNGTQILVHLEANSDQILAICTELSVLKTKQVDELCFQEDKCFTKQEKHAFYEPNVKIITRLSSYPVAADANTLRICLYRPVWTKDVDFSEQSKVVQEKYDRLYQSGRYQPLFREVWNQWKTFQPAEQIRLLQQDLQYLRQSISHAFLIGIEDDHETWGEILCDKIIEQRETERRASLIEEYRLQQIYNIMKLKYAVREVQYLVPIADDELSEEDGDQACLNENSNSKNER